VNVIHTSGDHGMSALIRELSWGVAMGKDIVGAVVSMDGEEISKDEVSRVGAALEVAVMTLGLTVVCNDGVVGLGLKVL